MQLKPAAVELHSESNSVTSSDKTTLSAFREANDIGILKVTGNDTLDLLNRLSTNNVLNIEPYNASHTILTNDKGRIIDIIYVVNMESYYLLITSPGQDQLIMDWLDKYTIMEDIEYANNTSHYSVFHILKDELSPIFETSNSAPNTSQIIEVNTPIPDSLLIPYQLGDIRSYLLITEQTNQLSAYNHLSNYLTFWDPAQYEHFRIGQKIPLHGSELSEQHNPLEAGLIGAIDFHKGCYIGQEVIARLDSYDKVQKHLSFIEINTEGNNHSNKQLFFDGKSAGIITSAQHNENSFAPFGMAYIHKNYSKAGTTLLTNDGGKILVLENPLFFGEEK